VRRYPAKEVKASGDSKITLVQPDGGERELNNVRSYWWEDTPDTDHFTEPAAEGEEQTD
jgi:hypothetical protein